jgi:hypothetical protein
MFAVFGMPQQTEGDSATYAFSTMCDLRLRPLTQYLCGYSEFRRPSHSPPKNCLPINWQKSGGADVNEVATFQALHRQ